MIVIKRVKIKIAMPKPILFKNSDCIYSLAIGCNFGTKIIVTIVDNIHLENEIKLREKPLKKTLRNIVNHNNYNKNIEKFTLFIKSCNASIIKQDCLFLYRKVYK